LAYQTASYLADEWGVSWRAGVSIGDELRSMFSTDTKAARRESLGSSRETNISVSTRIESMRSIQE